MLRRCILMSLWMTCVAACACAQGAQPPPPLENTPGASLRAERAPIVPGTIQVPGFQPEPFDSGYSLRATGFRKGEPLLLSVRWPGNPQQPPTDAFVDSDGLVHVVMGQKRLPFLLLVPAAPKGLTYIVGLSTTDRKTSAWMRFTPNPLQARHRNCRASGEVEKGFGEVYLISASGFQADETLQISTEGENEKQDSTGHARDDGTWQGRVTLPKPTKESVKAKFVLSGQSCKLTLMLERVTPTTKVKTKQPAPNP